MQLYTSRFTLPKDVNNSLITKQLKGSDNPSALLILCPDNVRTDEAKLLVIEKLTLKDAATKIFFGDELQVKHISEISDLLYSNSLFSSQQLIEIKRADKIQTAAVDALLKITINADNPNKLLLTGKTLKANSRLKKHFKKKPLALIEIPKLAEKELSVWTKEQAKKHNLILTNQLSTLLSEIAEYSPDRIENMLSHLSLYCSDNKPTAKTILTLFHKHPDPNEFSLIEKALSSKGSPEAEKTLNELLMQGKNEFLLLNLIGKTLSRLLEMRVLLDQNLAPAEIQSRTKISPWIFKKQLPLAHQLSSQHLENLLRKVSLADSRLKNHSLGAAMVMTELLKEIAPPKKTNTKKTNTKKPNRQQAR